MCYVLSHKNQQNKKESKMRNGNFMFIFQQLHNFGLMDDHLTCFLSQILLFGCESSPISRNVC